MTDQAPQRTRLTKSKATASTTALQTLEITTTAVVTSDSSHLLDPSPPDVHTEDDTHSELSRKQSHHHHHHHIRSPAFEANSNIASPLPSPQLLESITPLSAELVLPPPIVKGPSEAIVALQDAANASNSNKKSNKKCHSSSTSPEMQLFESSFFSAALLIQWSNLMGPKVEKVWSVEPLEEKLQMMIGRQVLNGEMGRTLEGVEPKWIVLHRQAIICTAFLFHDPTLESLCALVLVVPVRYLRNFSQYFHVLCDRIPNQLVEPLLGLRRIYKRHAISWSVALNYFTIEKLVPFVKSVMDLESVSLPMDCVKTSHTILDYESKQMLDSPFIAKFVKYKVIVPSVQSIFNFYVYYRVITSHLQTFGSTLLVGNSLTSMNMVINTLALFLSTEERSRSSHARKHHHYMPDLYLQGLLIQDVEEMDTKVEIAVLDSTVPTTLVDMNRLIVRKTPLYNTYNQLRAHYHTAVSSKLEENLVNYISDANASSNLNDWSKRQNVFEKTDCIAPMVQTLLDETRRIPTRMRESYVRQWRRTLVRRALAMIKFVQDETPVIICQPTDNDLVSRIMNALALYHMSDFIIVLTQAEKLRPGMVEFITTYSKRL